MKRAIVVVLLLCLTGCAGRVVTIPTPPDAAKAIEAITVSNIPANQKAEVVGKVLEQQKETYRMSLERANQAGGNVKDAWIQVVQLVASITALAFGVSR